MKKQNEENNLKIGGSKFKNEEKVTRLTKFEFGSKTDYGVAVKIPGGMFSNTTGRDNMIRLVGTPT